MTKQIFRGLVVCLLLTGCGSSGKSGGNPDGPVRPPTDVGPSPDDLSTVPPDDLSTVPPLDAGTSCDEDAMGVDYCIKNPGDNRGGGVKVTRLPVGPCSK